MTSSQPIACSTHRRPQSRLQELREALATVGWRRTCTLIAARMTDAIFDWRYGLDTVERARLETLDIPGDTKHRGTPYQPTSLIAFRTLMRALDLPRDCGFLDYGCGKGRALLLAADAGFHPVIGVEFAPSLCTIARANVAAFRQAKPHVPSVEVVTDDASQYDPPPTIGIFYFYHPFDATLMGMAVDRILRSLRDHPRDAWLIYNLPRHRAAVERHHEWTIASEIRAGGYDCIVYRYRP